MAVVLTNAIEEPTVAQLLSGVKPDLRYLWVQSGIHIQIQARLAQLGYTAMEIFAGVDDTAPAVRAFVQTEVGLKQEGNPLFRAQVAAVLAAWQAAETRGRKRRAEDAEQRVGDLPRKMPKKIYNQLLQSYNDSHPQEKLLDTNTPASCYLEDKLEQLEEGQLEAEKLTEVGTRTEMKKDDFGDAKITSDGSFKIKRATSVSVPLPKNSEELRFRIKVMATNWELIMLNLPNHPDLQDMGPQVWQSHVEYVLGKKVYQAEIKARDRSQTYTPSWLTVLEYEYQIRVRAAELVNASGRTLAAAMKEAREDQEVFRDHFITPVSFSAGIEAAHNQQGLNVPSSSRTGAGSSTSAGGSDLTAQIERAIQTGTAKAVQQALGLSKGASSRPSGKSTAGKGKNQTKGKGKSKAQPAASNAASGRTASKTQVHMITFRSGKCLAFNKDYCQRGQDCPYPHECSVCGRSNCRAIDHPVSDLRTA